MTIDYWSFENKAQEIFSYSSIEFSISVCDITTEKEFVPGIFLHSNAGKYLHGFHKAYSSSMRYIISDNKAKT